MPSTAGYSIEQLLSWCLEDRLIDGFERQEGIVVIVRGASRHELRATDAERFLKGFFRCEAVAPRLSFHPHRQRSLMQAATLEA